MKHKNYYTVAEIILALRQHYLQSQILLNEMKQQIRVESKEPFYSNFDLSLGSNLELNAKDANVTLRVTKDSLLPMGTFFGDSTRNINPHNICPRDKNHTYFDIMNDNDYYYFISMKNALYHPKAYIPLDNQKKFASLYNKLQNMKLYELKELFIDLNCYQKLLICGSGIYLYSNGEKGKKIVIYYNADDDKIHIQSDKKYSRYFVEKLLETQIPSYAFNEDYIFILEYNREDINNVYIDDSIGKKKETLLLEEKIKKMVLKRG